MYSLADKVKVVLSNFGQNELIDDILNRPPGSDDDQQPAPALPQPDIPKVIPPPASFQGGFGDIYTDENTGGQYILSTDGMMHLLL